MLRLQIIILFLLALFGASHIVTAQIGAKMRRSMGYGFTSVSDTLNALARTAIPTNGEHDCIITIGAEAADTAFIRGP